MQKKKYGEVCSRISQAGLVCLLLFCAGCRSYRDDPVEVQQRFTIGVSALGGLQQERWETGKNGMFKAYLSGKGHYWEVTYFGYRDMGWVSVDLGVVPGKSSEFEYAGEEFKKKEVSLAHSPDQTDIQATATALYKALRDAARR